MSHFIQQSIRQVLSTYHGDGSFSLFLKKYFSAQPLLGSRDRKAITEALYIFFRTAPFLNEETDALKVIKIGYEWCGSENEFLKKTLKEIETPAFNFQKHCLAWQQNHAFSLELSNGITLLDWLSAMRVQPYLFIRLVGDKAQQQKNLNVLKYSEGFVSVVSLHSELSIIALKNSFKVHQFLNESAYVVQDLSSQTTVVKALSLIETSLDAQKSLKVWDVCAGAGGKSLLWKYLRGNDLIWTTDVRASILNQLKKRFHLYGMSTSKAIILDLLDSNKVKMSMRGEKFDVLLCDVPCSGSGTWSRTPEQFYYFSQEEVLTYPEKQFTIAANSLPYLKDNGYLIYITCSVFRAENEAVVERLQTEMNLSVVHQELILNVEWFADSLFIALLKK